MQKKNKQIVDNICYNKNNNLKNYFKHFVPSNKEWYNSIYTYNKAYLMNIPVFDKVIVKLIKSYFNLYNKTYEKKVRTERILTRFKRLSLNRILVSKAEIKHTNDTVTLILYTYNRQKNFLLNKIKKMRSIELIKKNKKRIKILKNLSVLNKTQNVLLEKRIAHVSNIISYISFSKKIANKLILKISVKQFINKVRQEKKNKLFTNFLDKKLIKLFEKEILNAYYKYLLFINKNKFNKKYLILLGNLLGKIYKKKINFYIIDLKYFFLNTDILAQSIAIKIKNRKNKLVNVLRNSIAKVKIPFINKLAKDEKNTILDKANFDLTFKENDKFYNILKKANIIENYTFIVWKMFLKTTKSDYFILKNQFYTNLISFNNYNYNNDNYNNCNNNDYNNKFNCSPIKSINIVNDTSNVITNVDNIFIQNISIEIDKQEKTLYYIKNICELLELLNTTNKNILNLETKTYDTIYNFKIRQINNKIFDYIKYKSIIGIRIEASGRLSKRLTAQRSLFKLRYKGGLKDINSSYKGLSSSILRGHAKSNTQYTLINSKTRNGAFGLKGWIASN